LTPQEFDQQMLRLSNTYGAQYFKQDRLTLLWGKVKDYSPTWFKGVVDNLLSSCRQAPLPADFEDAISIERERRWKDRKHERLEVSTVSYMCKLCKGTGTLLCSHPNQGGMWGFRCRCSIGQNDPRRGLPMFTPEREQEGFTWHDMPVYQGARA
jgi:hypothetical protein